MPWSLEIHHIDVGAGYKSSGDSTLIVAKYEPKESTDEKAIIKSVLIDGGLKAAGTDVVHPYILSILPNSLDVMVATHYDKDHVNGLTGILETYEETDFYKNTRIYDQGMLYNNNDIYTNYLNAAKGRRATAFVASDIDQWNGDGQKTFRKYYDKMSYGQRNIYEKEYKANKDTTLALPPFWLIGQEIMWGEEKHEADNRPTITCVAANQFIGTTQDNIGRTFPKSLLDTEHLANQKSLGFLVQFGNFKYYIAGDLESTQENELCALLNHSNNEEGRILAVKLSHHGSSGSSSRAFLNRMKPKVAFISCGLWNQHGHPQERIIGDLQRNVRLLKYYLTGFPNLSKDSIIGNKGVIAGTYLIETIEETEFVAKNKYYAPVIDGIEATEDHPYVAGNIVLSMGEESIKKEDGNLKATNDIKFIIKYYSYDLANTKYKLKLTQISNTLFTLKL